MLPSLSSSWGATLQPLAPVVVEPASVSARRSSLLELKKVVAVHVTDRTGKGYKARYALEIFTDAPDSCVVPATSSNRVQEATAESSRRSEELPTSSDRPRRPAVRNGKSVGEFTDLRDQVYKIVHTAHRGDACEFCADLLNFIVFGPNPDSMTLRLLGQERVARRLSKFVTDLLALTVQHSFTEGRGACAGQTHIPPLVHKFLFEATPEPSDAA
ncbi:hypothetical protein BBJ28_00014453 [Nothophytophthora sp. Chile5]|nr:hypothetical protein BBJ28_00014453 [Nothophytophthora sp. Chile5]